MGIKDEIKDKREELIMLKNKLKESLEAEKQAKREFITTRENTIEGELIVLNNILKAIYGYKKASVNKKYEAKILERIKGMCEDVTRDVMDGITK